MIKINTCHIPQDEPLIVEGEESSDILELKGEENFPLNPVSDISYSLSAAMARGDLLVTGSAWFQLETLCARCLEKIQPVIRAENLCLFFEKCPDQVKDITEDIREELLLRVPLTFHCKEDCRGLCAGCGANLNYEECSCGEKASEQTEEQETEQSPWDVLDSLK